MVVVKFCPALTLSGADKANLVAPSAAGLMVNWVIAEFAVGFDTVIVGVPAFVSL